jgi:hypothetical protein
VARSYVGLRRYRIARLVISANNALEACALGAIHSYGLPQSVNEVVVAVGFQIRNGTVSMQLIHVLL